MKLEVNIFDYVPPEKITEIAEDELRRAFREQFDQDEIGGVIYDVIMNKILNRREET